MDPDDAGRQVKYLIRDGDGEYPARFPVRVDNGIAAG
jgi:hypothetical protein